MKDDLDLKEDKLYTIEHKSNIINGKVRLYKQNFYKAKYIKGYIKKLIQRKEDFDKNPNPPKYWSKEWAHQIDNVIICEYPIDMVPERMLYFGSNLNKEIVTKNVNTNEEI